VYLALALSASRCLAEHVHQQFNAASCQHYSLCTPLLQEHDHVHTYTSHALCLMLLHVNNTRSCRARVSPPLTCCAQACPCSQTQAGALTVHGAHPCSSPDQLHCRRCLRNSPCSTHSCNSEACAVH
jgi:hypothetical protein